MAFGSASFKQSTVVASLLYERFFEDFPEKMTIFCVILRAPVQNRQQYYYMRTTEQLGNKLRILREVHNYTQEYVANVLDIAPNTYGLMEKGETKFNLERLERLAGLYNMDLVDLLQMNERTVIHSITHSQGICSSQVTINNPMTEEERKMYQQTIARLERENERLIALLDKMTEKFSGM